MIGVGDSWWKWREFTGIVTDLRYFFFRRDEVKNGRFLLSLEIIDWCRW